MSATKTKIIQQAIEIFNQQGYQSTTLVDIARALNMSRGNLAYHFPDKEAVLQAIAEQLDREIADELRKGQARHSFENLQISIQGYHRLQQTYPFIFGNDTVLQHDCIQRVMKRWSERTIQDVRAAFAFAIEVGNMRPEPFPGLYHHLATNTWMIIYYWNSQKLVREDESLDNAAKQVWSTVVPHFTEKGIGAFEKYFGKGFLQELGEPLLQRETPIHETITEN